MSNQSNSKMVACPKCRIESSSLAARCRNCGARLPAYPVETPQDEVPETSTTHQAETTDRSNVDYVKPFKNGSDE